MGNAVAETARRNAASYAEHGAAQLPIGITAREPLEALDAFSECRHGRLPHEGCQRGCFIPMDPFEALDAAHECKHGRVPMEGCPEGCFTSPMDELGQRQRAVRRAADRFDDLFGGGAEREPAADSDSAPVVSTEFAEAFQTMIQRRGGQLADRVIAGGRLTKKQQGQLRVLQALDGALNDLDLADLLASVAPDTASS